MPLSQKFRDLLLGRGGSMLGDCRDHNPVNVSNAQQLLLNRGVWGYNDVILIRSHPALAFRFQYPDNTPGCIPDADFLADWVQTGEQIVHNRLADEADTRRGRLILFGKEGTALQLPEFDRGIVYVDAIDTGHPVLVPVNHGRSGTHNR